MTDWFDDAVGGIDERSASEAEVEKAVAWKPDKDENIPALIKGRTFHEIRVASTKYGGAYIVYIKDDELTDDDGNAVIWELFASRSVLKRELQDASPSLGSRIVVKWEDTRTSASGVTYHSYKVAAEEPDTELWAKLVRDLYDADQKRDRDDDVEDTIATEEDLEKVF